MRSRERSFLIIILLAYLLVTQDEQALWGRPVDAYGRGEWGQLELKLVKLTTVNY